MARAQNQLLHRTLMAIVIGISLLALLGAGVLTRGAQGQASARDSAHLAEALALSLAQSAFEDGVLQRGFDTLPHSLRYMVAYDAKGETLSALGDHPRLKLVDSARTKGQHPGVWIATLQADLRGAPQLADILVKASPQLKGAAYIQLGISLSAPGSASAQSKLLALAPLVMCLAFLTLIAWVLIDITLSPLRSLVMDVQAMDPRSSPLTLSNRAPLEFQILARGWNRRARQIQALQGALQERQLQIEEEMRGRMLVLKEATQRAEALAEEAKATSQAKSDFLATMSHELRTPMNGVLGMVDVLLTTELNPSQHQYVSTLKRSGKALLHVIGEILDLSKLEANKVELEQVDFDLREEIEDVMGLLAESAHAKDLDFLSHIPGSLPTQLRGDPARLRQVITNLLGNAIKFTDSGHVILRVVPITDGAQEGESVELRIEVEDTGIGVPSEMQGKIFESFAQGDSSTTRRYGGTGLGLTITRRLVEKMKGQVGMSSSEGRGSLFWMHLTLERGESKEEPSEVRSINLSKLRALVIEESAAATLMICQHLATWGVTHRIATSLEEASLALGPSGDAPLPFDVIVMGTRNAPTWSGAFAAKLIKSGSFPLDRLCLISPVHLASQGPGGPVVISKPLRRGDLLDVFQTWAGGEPHPSPVNHFSPQLFEPLAGEVLVVEDNSINLEVIEALLDALGLKVMGARHGAEALRCLEETKPDLILMDCMMPTMDGYECTRSIREGDGDRAQIPILALSANASAADARRCLEAGMNGHLPKPIALEALYTALSKWLPKEPKKEALPAKIPPLSLQPKAAKEEVHRALARLETLDRRGGLIQRIISQFEVDSENLLRNLKEGLESDDLVRMRRAAHSLKSISGTLGASRLSALCRDVERAETRCGEYANLISTIQEELALLRAQLGQYAPGRAA